MSFIQCTLIILPLSQTLLTSTLTFPLTQLCVLYFPVQFVMYKYTYVWNLPYRVTHLPGITPLKKNDSSSLRSYWIPNSSSARNGALAQLLIFMLRFFFFTRAWESLAHAVTLSVGSYMQMPRCPVNSVSLCSSTNSASYSSSTPASEKTPEYWVVGYDINVPLKAGNLHSLIFCTLTSYVMGLCDNRLQEKVYVMWVDGYTNLWA